MKMKSDNECKPSEWTINEIPNGKYKVTIGLKDESYKMFSNYSNVFANKTPVLD